VKSRLGDPLRCTLCTALLPSAGCNSFHCTNYQTAVAAFSTDHLQLVPDKCIFARINLHRLFFFHVSLTSIILQILRSYTWQLRLQAVFL